MQRNLVFLIDLQNGFARADVPQEKGGCLYVPDGEACGPKAAQMIAEAEDTLFVLSQDFHPENHIGFMENHPGVMAWRKERALDLLAPPFDDVFLEKRNGLFHAVAIKDGAKIRAVQTDENGFVTRVSEKAFEGTLSEKGLLQTLWRKHCVQGTESALFDPALMKVLPPALAHDLETNANAPTLSATDERGNRFYVIRKGLKADLDSYGIARENDGVSLTEAPKIFAEIARHLEEQGASEARIAIGGLATNFCVEASHRDVVAFMVPMLSSSGVASSVTFLDDISRGIPLPDLALAPARMASMGTKISTSEDFMRPSFRAHGNHQGAQLKIG